MLTALTGPGDGAPVGRRWGGAARRAGNRKVSGRALAKLPARAVASPGFSNSEAAVGTNFTVRSNTPYKKHHIIGLRPVFAHRPCTETASPPASLLRRAPWCACRSVVQLSTSVLRACFSAPPIPPDTIGSPASARLGLDKSRLECCYGSLSALHSIACPLLPNCPSWRPVSRAPRLLSSPPAEEVVVCRSAITMCTPDPSHMCPIPGEGESRQSALAHGLTASPVLTSIPPCPFPCASTSRRTA